LLTDYKGKIRWTVRDFPLDFHARARPAAIAAHCAAKQGKYWHMYRSLFENQTKLSDADFKKYAGGIKGLDMAAWEKCVAAPADVLAIIDANMRTGSQNGVSGTPAFFINGRRLSGALPYEEFKRVIEDELKSGIKAG
jgi:protein-disulfide isomerase